MDCWSLKGFRQTHHKDYLVNKHGMVYSKKTKRILKPSKTGPGYLSVWFVVNGRGRNTQVHRLVAMAFVEGFMPGLDVNHKNGIKTDNRAENLEWVTRSENMLHSANVLGKRPNKGEKNHRAKLKDFEIEHIRIWVKEGFSRASVGRAYGVAGPYIGQICLEKLRKLRPPLPEGFRNAKGVAE